MSYSNTQDVLRQGQMSGARNSLKDGYVDIKVNKDAPEKEVRIRLIGLPFTFFQYQPRELDADGKKRIDRDFPDKDDKPKFARNWIEPGVVDDRYPDDPWSKAGFVGSLRYAQNVLLRNDDGSFEVKILEKGKMLFEQFAKIEDMNRRRNETRNKDYVTCLGGEETHELWVVAKFNIKKPLVADLTVAAEPDLVTITDEEIEALKKIGAPSEEELEELFARHPELEAHPRWFWYGFQLSRIYKPDLYPSTESSKTTSRGELDMSNASSDDDVVDDKPKTKPTVTTKTVATTGKTKPAAVAVAEPEGESAFAAAEETDTALDTDW